ncbi:SDR family NAD(P)-dependent oxidoreductase [Novosphingobium lindaniclasticum]|uniref:SDR family NAD(P)-dependent oxidoreductase n=1 Tax=Novosphingobium lindaniclasticum TaxID=1329895 RepID=UPI00389937B6
MADLGCKFISGDVADDASVDIALDKAEEAHGVARILVNCAGVAPGAKTVGNNNIPHSLETYRKTIEVNLIGTFDVISKVAARAVATTEIKGERGVIVNTSSVVAFDGQIGQAAFATSNSGVAGMTLPVARDLAQHKIREIMVAPGIFLTPMLKSPHSRFRHARHTGPHPSRLGRPEEYGQLVEAIVRNPMLNGEVIRLDGPIPMAPRWGFSQGEWYRARNRWIRRPDCPRLWGFPQLG